MFSLSVHFSHQRRRSPSSSVAMMRPREPFSVAKTQNSSFVNSATGNIDVMTSSALTGRTDGIGTPLAVRLAAGT
eukprot:2030222-Ditylum_brightwellii.AAC.1